MSLVSFRIIDAPDQQFSASLGGKRTTIRLRYNPTSERWSFNLAIDDQMVLHGRRVVTGVDLLEAFDFGIGIIFAGSERFGEELEPGKSQMINGEVKLFHANEEDLTRVIEEAENALTVSP